MRMKHSMSCGDAKRHHGSVALHGRYIAIFQVSEASVHVQNDSSQPSIDCLGQRCSRCTLCQGRLVIVGLWGDRLPVQTARVPPIQVASANIPPPAPQPCPVLPSIPSQQKPPSSLGQIKIPLRICPDVLQRHPPPVIDCLLHPPTHAPPRCKYQPVFEHQIARVCLQLRTQVVDRPHFPLHFAVRSGGGSEVLDDRCELRVRDRGAGDVGDCVAGGGRVVEGDARGHAADVRGRRCGDGVGPGAEGADCDAGPWSWSCGGCFCGDDAEPRLEEETGEHARADDGPGRGVLGAQEGAQVELLVKEALGRAAADDVVFDAELPRDVPADAGGEDGACDVQLAALGAGHAGAVDDGVEGVEEGGEGVVGGGVGVAREKGDAEVFEHLDVMGFGAGRVRDRGGPEQGGDLDGGRLGCGEPGEVGEDGEAELAGAEDEDGARGWGGGG